jgi:hypothetical protein
MANFEHIYIKWKNDLTNLQMPWKGDSNGRTPYDRMQPILKNSSRSTAQPPTTSDPKASYTHRQLLKLPQQHLPLDVRTTGRKSSSAKTAWPTDYSNCVIDSNRSPTPVNIPWNTKWWTTGCYYLIQIKKKPKDRVKQAAHWYVRSSQLLCREVNVCLTRHKNKLTRFLRLQATDEVPNITGCLENCYLWGAYEHNLVKWPEHESDQKPLHNVEITSGAILLSLYMSVLSI